MNKMNGIRRIRDEDEHGWAWKLTKIGVDVRDQILKKSPFAKQPLVPVSTF